MLRIFVIGLLSMTLFGCFEDEFPVLEGNIFEEENMTLFTLASVSRDTINQVRANITVTFTSSWAGATPEQKSTITALRIFGPRSDQESIVPPETTTHTMQFARFDMRNCIELTFLTLDETNTRTTEICVNP